MDECKKRLPKMEKQKTANRMSEQTAEIAEKRIQARKIKNSGGKILELLKKMKSNITTSVKTLKMETGMEKQGKTSKMSVKSKGNSRP